MFTTVDLHNKHHGTSPFYGKNENSENHLLTLFTQQKCKRARTSQLVLENCLRQFVLSLTLKQRHCVIDCFKFKMTKIVDPIGTVLYVLYV